MTHGLKIAVLGAGYIGVAFAKAATGARHQVWAVRRTAVPARDDGITWLAGDVSTGEVDGMPAQLDAVLLTIAPTGTSDSYRDTYPTAAAAAVTLARDSGARALIYTSSIGVYGGRDGAWVTEDSPRLGAGDSNATLMEAEDIILRSGAATPTVLRVAGIYGPGRDPRARMSAAAQLPQRGEYWVNLAHRDDIVSAVLHVLRLVDAPRVLNVSDGAPERACEVARWLATASGGDAAQLTFANADRRSRSDQRVRNVALVATGWAPRFPSFQHGFRSGL